MEEAQRLLNPRMLHLQKLALELKCPLCLQLFNRPVLLPCTHIFCSGCLPEANQLGSQCPLCKHQYFDREVKPAPFMENIVAIYRSLDATFNTNLFQPVCSDSGLGSKKNTRMENLATALDGNSSNGQSLIVQTTMPVSTNGSAEELINRNFEKCITPESGLKQGFRMQTCNKTSVSNSMKHMVGERQMETGVAGTGLIHSEQMSPPVSSDSKEMDGNSSDPSSIQNNAVRCPPKRPLEDDAYGTKGKRQKKANDQFGSETNAFASENVSTSSKKLDLKRGPCAFCHSSELTEGSGPLVSYAQGKKVEGNLANFAKITHVHEKCHSWAPRIYFKDGLIKNLESEVARANKLKCSNCGKKGACLGCYVKTCSRSYHVPCAYEDKGCRWDCNDFLMLCPKHISHKFPSEQRSNGGKQANVEKVSPQLNPCNLLLNAGKKMVLCGSALSLEDKRSLVKFAQSSGAIVSSHWKPDVTHVIAAVDSKGACTRTLKVLMAILNGKWIVTMKWANACSEAGALVSEEPYEVQLDTHGCSGGPKAGRLRILNNGPKLFNGFRFYFIGEFVQAFKTDLLSLVKTGGGMIIERKDELLSSSVYDVERNTFVVYNAGVSDQSEFEDEDLIKCQRVAAAEDLANKCGSSFVGHTWILESVAACKVLPIPSSSSSDA